MYVSSKMNVTFIKNKIYASLSVSFLSKQK